MALVVGTDAYIDVAGADTYFANRLYADGWINASPTDKEKALKMATKAIDRLKLNGKKADPTQILQFPRKFILNSKPSPYQDIRPIVLSNNRTGSYYIEPSVSTTVKDACCEEALAMLTKYNDPRVQMQRAGVTNVQIGGNSGTSETYKGGTFADLISFEARQLLDPYIGGTVVIAR